MPKTVCEMVKPAEKINSININHAFGFGRSIGGDGERPVLNQTLESILTIAVQLPVLKESGCQMGVNLVCLTRKSECAASDSVQSGLCRFICTCAFSPAFLATRPEHGCAFDPVCMKGIGWARRCNWEVVMRQRGAGPTSGLDRVRLCWRKEPRTSPGIRPVCTEFQWCSVSCRGCSPAIAGNSDSLQVRIDRPGTNRLVSELCGMRLTRKT